MKFAPLTDFYGGHMRNLSVAANLGAMEAVRRLSKNGMHDKAGEEFLSGLVFAVISTAIIWACFKLYEKYVTWRDKDYWNT